MKKVCCVSTILAGLIAFASAARADNTITPTSTDDDAAVQVDADGVPLNITQKSQRATPQEIAADRKARAQAALDKDWLVRDYEKQLQTHSATSTALDRTANPYQEVIADRDLANLAGLTDYHTDSASDEPLFRTKDAQADHGNGAALRPGSSSAAPMLKSAPFGSSFLTPQVTPMGAPDAAGIKNFYSSLPDAAMAPFNGSTPAPELHARTSVIPDPTDNDIETPGMIAAKNDPLTDPATLNPGLDMLPGESLEHAKVHQDNSEALLQLPIAMDAEQLHRSQASYLNPPVAKSALPTTTSSTATQPKPPTPLPDDSEQAVPASQMPVISPIRAPIANPYDILNR